MALLFWANDSRIISPHLDSIRILPELHDYVDRAAIKPNIMNPRSPFLTLILVSLPQAI